MIQKRIIPIAVPDTGKEECEAVSDTILSGWLTQGPKVAKFEERFAELHNVKHALAVTSCTTGLHVILKAKGIGPGDEVIVPSFTWISTANVVLHCGAKPVFVDVSLDDFNLDPGLLSSKINKNTKAIIPVHLFGYCADIDAIRDNVPDEVFIVEDAACAAGSTYKNKFAGSLGDAASFSFHPRKSITTGEGGMITTNNSELAEIMKQMINHGANVSEEQRHKGPKPYLLPDFNLLGFNYRMTDLQGAVGLVQLEKLSNFINERDKWANWYQKELSSLNWLLTPKSPSHGLHSWQAYVTYVDPKVSPIGRNAIMDKLQKNGVSTRPGTHALHMLDLYKNRFGFNSNDFPNSRDCYLNTMALPLHNRMSSEDYEYVVEMLKSID